MFLFAPLNDNEIDMIAEEFDDLPMENGDYLFKEGESSDHFYVIVSGNIHMNRRRGKKVDIVGTISSGDFFGVEGLILGERRTANAFAIGDTMLLMMDKEGFDWMLDSFPEIGKQMDALIRSYRLARRKNFAWVGDDEIVHLITRKHTAYLWLRLIGPLVMGMSGVGLLLWAILYLAGSLQFQLLGAILMMAAAGWGIWGTIDWGNDYYVVTDERVVWLEKIVALYDSRQEAPLSAVLSVNISTSQFQRIIKSGDVIIRTYTGTIILRNVNNPNYFAATINAYWQRSKEKSRQAQTEAMQQAVRDRLRGEEDLEEEYEEPIQPSRRVVKGIWSRLFGNFLKMRYEEDGNIIYRKHWILLLQKSWQPTLILTAVTAAVIFLYWPWRETQFSGIVGMMAVMVWGAVYIFLLVWWGYHYVDWRNDVYVLTGDKILDLERKPLGREEKRTAPLESVLNMEHSREGIIGLLLNYGNVMINVGATKLIFYGVFNPADVQHDIFDRMYALRKRMEAEQMVMERDRMVEWLSIYREESDVLENEQENNPDFY